MTFEKLLIKSVDDSLKDTFGESATAIIYRHLQRNHSLKQEEIPMKLEVFIKGLEEFFSSGATVIEKIVLKNLCSNLEVDCQNKRLSNFVDCVNKLKKAH